MKTVVQIYPAHIIEAEEIMIDFEKNKNFRANEQQLYWFKIWLLTRDSGCVPWIAKVAYEYLCMIENLREMNC